MLLLCNESFNIHLFCCYDQICGYCMRGVFSFVKILQPYIIIIVITKANVIVILVKLDELLYKVQTGWQELLML